MLRYLIIFADSITVSKVNFSLPYYHIMPKFHFRTEMRGSYAVGVADSYDPVTKERKLGEWRKDNKLKQAKIPTGTKPTDRAKELREYRKLYFQSSVGAVPWQDRMARKDSEVNLYSAPNIPP